eukprot:5722483-Alexandrium_andersonii.AAC.1
MSASLVGSEMCIRDRHCRRWRAAQDAQMLENTGHSIARDEGPDEESEDSTLVVGARRAVPA